MAKCRSGLGCNQSLMMTNAKIAPDYLYEDVLTVSSIDSFWWGGGDIWNDTAGTIPATVDGNVDRWDNDIVGTNLVYVTGSRFKMQTESGFRYLEGQNGTEWKLGIDPGIDISSGNYTIVAAIRQNAKNGVPYWCEFGDTQAGNYTDATQFAGGCWTGSSAFGTNGMGIYQDTGALIRQCDTEATTWSVVCHQSDFMSVNGVDVADPGGIEYTDTATPANAGIYLKQLGGRTTANISTFDVAVFIVTTEKNSQADIDKMVNFAMNYIGL